METAMRANPQDLREQHEKQPKNRQEAYGPANVGATPQGKIAVPAGRGQEVT
jgi:hypothetical protein